MYKLSGAPPHVFHFSVLHFIYVKRMLKIGKGNEMSYLKA